MGSNRVCPHSITLYNYVGENDAGKAQYVAALLTGVHVRASKGISSGDTSKDAARVHIFDDTAICDKTFMPHDEWAAAEDSVKEQHWTLDQTGMDYFAIGDTGISEGSLPTHLTLFRINEISRKELGSRRMWHWRIDAR